MKAVILAGGKGTRLKPYTAIFPKPLMPIGDKPILEIIVSQLKSHALPDIIITTGHLSELIIAFFGDGSQLGVNIKYSKEDKPLGTAGGLGLLKEELKDTFLMINGDTLTTLDFSELINCHKTSGAIATIALKKRGVYIDFGIVELDSSNVIRGYTEKPTIHHLVSMGVYVFESRVLEYIKPDERLDFPDLVKTLLSKNEKINGFVFDGYWLDIGRPEDYEKANEEIEELNRILKL
ncbi:MAG: nucleotidyltransferase family protein [Chloroflexi bacterium]|nr:nucleotidyltransferase family protein [Chloroflexota bacterium]